MSGAAAIIADRSPFGAPLQCFSARAALPGITGCKREDPLRHQCSEHLTVRTRAGRDDARAACKREVTNFRPQAPLPLRQSASPVTSLTKSGMRPLQRGGRRRQGIYSIVRFAPINRDFLRLCGARRVDDGGADSEMIL